MGPPGVCAPAGPRVGGVPPGRSGLSPHPAGPAGGLVLRDGPAPAVPARVSLFAPRGWCSLFFLLLEFLTFPSGAVGSAAVTTVSAVAPPGTGPPLGVVWPGSCVSLPGWWSPPPSRPPPVGGGVGGTHCSLGSVFPSGSPPSAGWVGSFSTRGRFPCGWSRSSRRSPLPVHFFLLPCVWPPRGSPGGVTPIPVRFFSWSSSFCVLPLSLISAGLPDRVGHPRPFRGGSSFSVFWLPLLLSCPVFSFSSGNPTRSF